MKEDDLDEFYMAFGKYDTEEDGTIDVGDFKKTMKRLELLGYFSKDERK